MMIDTYIEEHSEKAPDYLIRIERDTWLTQINPRMVSGHLQGRVLSMLSKMIQPVRILELGTFTGYSALCLAEGLQVHGTLDTIEIDDELEDVIRRNFSMTPYDQKIKLHIGDAHQILCDLEPGYDLVFMDADKNSYSEYFEMVLPLVRNGGFVLVDNTLWNGKVVEENIQQNDKQTHEILRFNQELAVDNRVEKVILPLRDGLTVVRKKD